MPPQCGQECPHDGTYQARGGGPLLRSRKFGDVLPGCWRHGVGGSGILSGAATVSLSLPLWAASCLGQASRCSRASVLTQSCRPWRCVRFRLPFRACHPFEGPGISHGQQGTADRVSVSVSTPHNMALCPFKVRRLQLRLKSTVPHVTSLSSREGMALS